MDVVRYELYKGQLFTQSGTNSPVLATNLPYAINALASPELPSYVTNPVIKTPAGVSHPLTLSGQAYEGSYTTNYVFNASAATSNALDTNYGTGNYTLTYTGKDDGATSDVLSLKADNYPPAPFVSNLLAAQTINASSNFTLSFSAWLPGNSNNLVQLTILGSNGTPVFATPAPDQFYPQAPLSATNNSIVVSNGTLSAGQTYTGILTRTRLTTNNLYTFVSFPFLMGGFFSQTAFTLQTKAPPPPQTNNPAPPVSPVALTNTLLAFTITSGTGPFPASGTYELFTSPLGTNYTVLGNAGAGFGSGGYVYAQTGTNTGVVTFSDSHAGAVSLQIVFNSAGGGTFILTNSTAGQQGAFTATPGYSTVSPPNLFLPVLTNGQFQAYLSGDRGVNYTIDSSTNLTSWTALTNLTVQNLTTNFLDNASSMRRFYRARVGSVGFAPTAITGQSFSSSINSGTPPFSTHGAFQWAAGTNGNTYQLLGITGATNGAGSYTYTVTGPNTALISYTDFSTTATYNEQLVFSSTAGGYFYTTNSGGPGAQSGSFKMASGPVLFLGNVKFTPDTSRATSASFLADGTPLSLSVTDAVGYVWSLSAPADALLTPATLSMTPFAGINTNQSALPIISGVQLGPEGIQFCDGVTLTLTTPAPLGPYATLMMGAGDGSNLGLVQTTNHAASYSTTIFHFSAGAASDPSAQQLANMLAEVKAAITQAESDLLNVQKQQAAPPEPPDDEFKCEGNPGADAQVDEYVFNLFSEETAVINNLLSAAHALQLLGDNSDADYAISLVEPFISTEVFRKVNSLYTTWSGKPLKFSAYAKAALTASRQDQLVGGAGVPGLDEQLQSWFKGNVVAHYWDKLLKQHDYSMAKVLLTFPKTLYLLGGTPQNNNFIQDVANGYTFKVNLTVSDIGANNYSIKAHGTVTVTGSTGASMGNGYSVINPIGDGTGKLQLADTFSYDSGTYAKDTLQLPLSFTDGAVFNLGCSDTTVAMFIYSEMGSFNELWNGPDFTPGETQDFLIYAFDSAFKNTYSTLNIIPSWDCSYVFPVQWQNMQAQPVNATFTGASGYVQNEVVTFTIVVVHNPQSAPPTLTL